MNPKIPRRTVRQKFITATALPIEALEERRLFAVVASFSAGTLSVFGDNLANNITVRRNAAGNLLVNGGAVAVTGGTSTVANTSLIQIFGQGENDTIALNEANGALPRANLFGGNGNDTLTGGSGADQIFGQAGNDTLLGKGGVDFLFGGADNDTLTAGDGDDQAFGESGNDRMIWNPGDDTDLNEGGADLDTVEVNGGSGAEQFTVTANGQRVRFDRINPAPFSLDIGTSEKLVLNANGGDDSFSAIGNLAPLIQITVDGGTGNDTLLGSNGNDLLLGGDGNDFVDGNQGNDTALLGNNDDTFQWDPGDGSDTVEGGDGADRLIFNGSGASEAIVVSANGDRVRLTRNVANIVMDVEGVGRIDLNLVGGSDSVQVNDMAATDLAQVNVDLAGAIGGTTGDGAADLVDVHGSNGVNVVNVVGSGSSYAVTGLKALVNVTGSEGANDALVLRTFGNNDKINATTLPAGVVRATLDAGDGNDAISGSQGDDVILGGNGNDAVLGGRGNDVAFLGAGDDTFTWNPGDGNDTVEGQADTDRLLFVGANIAENVNVLANGGRVLFTRDVANVTMDLDDVESIGFRALGGADNVTLGDMTGTDLAQLDVSFKNASEVGDGAADTMTVNGTQNADRINVTRTITGSVVVSGLRTRVQVGTVEAANDRLTINGQGGDDVIDASALPANVLPLTINGGLGRDRLIGSQGNDRVNGGDGNDVALMGAGDDTFTWNPGDDDDVLEGQAGIDAMIFNGANISENVAISANGNRARFTRDVANVAMDLNDVERIDFNALGGADTITVNDLTGTDVRAVNLFLAPFGSPTGDGQADTVVVNGTGGVDEIFLTGDASVLGVDTSRFIVAVVGAEGNLDRLRVQGLGGDDTIDARNVKAGSIALTLDGGADDDVLRGGDGADTLLGGPGDDVLIGGLGNDLLDGGTGNNVVIQ